MLFNFLKSKKKSEPKPDTSVEKKEKNSLIETMREKHGFIFSNDIGFEEFDRRTKENTNRRVLPIDIDPSQIAAISRYKGSDIGFYFTNKGLGFYLVKQAPVRLFVSMTRKDNPINQHEYMVNEIMNLIEVEVVNLDDVQFTSEFTDTYFQKYLLMLIPFMEVGNRIMLNRNGLSLELKGTISESELLLIMSFLQQVHENINKHS